MLMEQLAKDIAEHLKADYIKRQKLSVEEFISQFKDDILIIGKNRFVIYSNKHASEPIFFHPNSAMFRVKRVIRGEPDPFITAAQIQPGMSLLDCTLGLASDSIVASVVVGQTGRVVGIEGNEYMSFLVKNGLQAWHSGSEIMNAAMRKIEVRHAQHLDFLLSQPSSSFDIVYFDPMFEEILDSSTGIKGLRNIAVYTSLTEEVMREALRVARKRVVLKDHWKSTRFNQFGFTVYKRKTAKFHFGILEK